MLAPGKQVANPLDAISLGLALMLGTGGLPHILMRFYTVPDARAARRSVFYATGLIGFFYLVTFVLGFGAAVLVGQPAIRAVDKGGNMAAPLLAEVVGGTGLLGFIAAVAFATILAVVAGLTLSGAATLSHDLWVNVVRKGEAADREQLLVARGASLLLGLLAIVLGVVFKGQNVAFMVGLAFAIAASANFPALVMSLTWSRFTTRGAVASMLVGNIVSIGLIALSPTVLVDLLGQPSAVFPLKNPGIVSVPLAFAVGVLVSLIGPEPAARAGYTAISRRMLLGARDVTRRA
jgi:cation/acetate symporter